MTVLLDSNGWPVTEQVLIEAFLAGVSIPGKQVYVGTVTTSESQWPAIRVQRLPGGGLDRNGLNDRARIEVVTYGTTYTESSELTSQVRGVLAGLDNGEFSHDGQIVGLDRISEDVGPGRIPDPNQDLRAVPTVWVVVTRQQ